MIDDRTANLNLPKPNVDNTQEEDVQRLRDALDGLDAVVYGKQATLGFTPENAANKGQPNGYAGLGSDGKVVSAQLPSFVDDVLEYANVAAFPGVGESGKIYVALDSNKTYRWSGSIYVEISPSPGSTDGVAEGSANLYFTALRAKMASAYGGINKSANYAVAAADSKSLIRVSTASGLVTITLPQISTLTQDFDVLVAKVTSDTNIVAVARSGTDTINGATTFNLTSQWHGAWLIADRSTNTWTVISSASPTAVNPVVDTFTGNGTPGPFILSGDPGVKENTAVYIGGTYQQKSTYTLVGTSLTAGGNVDAGVSVEVIWVKPMQVGITSANLVTADDGASGSRFTTVQEFITEVDQTVADTALAAVAPSVAASQAAQTAAEAARDAAIIQSGVYATETAGRAAVADGVAFKVQGSGNVAAYEYRRVNSTTSTLIATYPSIAAYDALGARATDLESARDFIAGVDPTLRVIKRLRLFGANPAKIYRLRYFFRNDIGTRLTITVQQVDDASGANPVDVCQFLTTGVNYSGLVEFTLSRLSSSGITGTVVIDFTGAASSWGIFSASAATQIRSDAIISSAAEASYIDGKISTALNTGTLATRVSNLEGATDFGPSCNALFRNVKKLRLWGANTSKFYSVRYFFRNDIGTRFNFTVTQADDAAGTNPVDVCSFSSANVNYSGLTEFTLAQMSSSGVTGTLLVDFTSAPASFVLIRGLANETFSTLAIRADAIITSAAESAYIDGKVSTAVGNASGLTTGLKIPFADGVSNDALRRRVKELWVYGCNPAHNYAISMFNIEQFAGIPLTRFLFSISDLTTGNIVCRYSYQVSSLPSLASFLASIPQQVKLTDSAITPKSAIYAVATLDLSSVAAWQANAYTTMAQAGISSKRTLSDEQIADYLDRDFWHEVIRVGAGESFTTLRAAVESLYIDPVLPNYACNRSHYNNRILIDLVDDGTYNATFLNIPEFVEVRGNGVDRTFIKKENDSPDALMEAHVDTKFRDCTIVSDTGDGGSWAGEYCIHSDDFNRTTPGSKTQNRRLRQSFKRMKLIAGPNQNVWIFGCGISSGETIRFEDVIAEHTNVATNVAAFGFHNSGPTISYPSISASYKPSIVEMRGCRSPDSTPYGVYLQSLDPTTKCRLVLHGCDFNLVYHTIATGEVVTDKAADRYGWEIGGVHAGPILQTDPDGMLVLGTTAGVSVSGTAADAIFGTVDELGRGDLWIKTGTVKSIGARLGNCTSASKTLTIGGQTWTANQDYTSQSNSTIIAAINTAITINPVAEVNIQYEIYPDTGFTRRMLNNTGASIPRGRFVKKTGANTIALATGDDEIFGWVYREIRDGLSGHVVTTKKIATQYMTGATTDGKFGVTNGQVDYAASTKKGSVVGGIATVW